MTLVLANGTLLTATPKSQPHLFRALGVSVGRLGVVTELTLRIKPQMAVTKSLQELKFKQFSDQIKAGREGSPPPCTQHWTGQCASRVGGRDGSTAGARHTAAPRRACQCRPASCCGPEHCHSGPASLPSQQSTQDKYTAAKARGDVEGMKKALFEVDETQVGVLLSVLAPWVRSDLPSSTRPLSYCCMLAPVKHAGPVECGERHSVAHRLHSP